MRRWRADAIAGGHCQVVGPGCASGRLASERRRAIAVIHEGHPGWEGPSLAQAWHRRATGGDSETQGNSHTSGDRSRAGDGGRSNDGNHIVGGAGRALVIDHRDGDGVGAWTDVDVAEREVSGASPRVSPTIPDETDGKDDESTIVLDQDNLPDRWE